MQSSQTSAQRLSASQRWAYCGIDSSMPTGRLCSTPFGITEVGMRPPPSTFRPIRQCSTPFGITEVGIMPKRRQAAPDARVLNAFRHHRGGHDLVGSCRRCRDRVLNAFRHHRGGHAGEHWRARRRSPSAQRLSASQRWASQIATRRRPELIRVLNAFRHHRGGHHVEPMSTQAVCRVLNAFRHHRGGHTIRSTTRPDLSSAQRLSASQRWACTMYGRLCGDHDVLNAFRHHRGGHDRRPSR